MNGLDLFSGIGGLTIALAEWVRPLAYCEIDSYCQGVLLSRMADESLRNCPIWDDIKTLDGNIFKGAIDIIYGGFPCQDISIAGLGKGLEGERSGLFFEIIRLCREIEPRFIFLENVPAITTRGGAEVVRQIATLGYDCRWCVISAASVGAQHKRERWFLLAYSNDNGSHANKNRGSFEKLSLSWEETPEQTKNIGEVKRTTSISSYVANANGQGCNEEQRRKPSGLYQKNTKSTNSDIKNICNPDNHSIEQTNKKTKPSQKRTWGGHTGQYWPFESRDDWQKVVSEMGKCSDGISNYVDRLRSLGNAVVPIQAKEAFKILMGVK